MAEVLVLYLDREAIDSARLLPLLLLLLPLPLLPPLPPPAISHALWAIRTLMPRASRSISFRILFTTLLQILQTITFDTLSNDKINTLPSILSPPQPLPYEIYVICPSSNHPSIHPIEQSSLFPSNTQTPFSSP